MKSTYFVVPVHPDGASAFVAAQSPVDLVNYGNRAWCRVEFYIFLCLSEICGEELKCFGYGPTDGRAGLDGKVSWFACFRKSVESLKPMAER